MNTGNWSAQVSVRDGQNIVHIGSARQAADFLILHWPDEHRNSRAHLHAEAAVLDVLQGIHDPEYARQAFVDAAREAGILVEKA